MVWEEATSDALEDTQSDDTLEPTVPLDQQMICDIQCTGDCWKISCKGQPIN